MKTFKTLLLTLTAVLLTGCYTQLQYTKSSKSSKSAKEQSASGYSWTENDPNQNGENGNKRAVKAKTQKSQKTDMRDECLSKTYQDKKPAQQEIKGCDTITNYYFYNPTINNPARYSYYNSANPFYHGFDTFYNPWHQYRYYPRSYGSRFNISLSWGYPYSSYYGYSSYGYPYGYGNHSVYAQNYYDFYSSGYYNNDSSSESTRYGMRSIGTDRVNTDRNRSQNRSVEGGRSAARSTRSGTVRNRSSVGTTRTQTIVRSRNSQSSQQGKRNRGNGTIRSRNNSDKGYYSDEQLQNRARHRLETLETVPENNRNNRRSTFFNRLKGFFGRTAHNIGTTDDHSTYRSRGRASHTTIQSNDGFSSGGGRSRVGRSRSSSSSSGSSTTRSRSSSSSSRSRSSSDDGGSSSQRSRDN